MFMQSVLSSNIRAIGYEPSTSTLEIEFYSGGIYQYRGVPAGKHLALMSAASHGGYFHAHIRNQYSQSRIR